MDLVKELPEAPVFGQPCPNLREQSFGDIDRAGLARFFEGEVLAGVQRAAVVTAAVGVAAAVGVGAEGGGEDGRGSREFLEAVLEHPQDDGGVVGAAHTTLRGGRLSGVRRFSGKRRKRPGARKTSAKSQAGGPPTA